MMCWAAAAPQPHTSSPGLVPKSSQAAGRRRSAAPGRAGSQVGSVAGGGEC